MHSIRSLASSVLQTRTGKVVASVGALGVATSVAGLATFGTFSDSTSVDTAVQSGTLSIDLGAPGGVPHVIPVRTDDFLPGDSLTRGINLENDGTVALSSVHLATTAGPSSALITDPVNGLQLTLTACSPRVDSRGHECPAHLLLRRHDTDPVLRPGGEHGGPAGTQQPHTGRDGQLDLHAAVAEHGW
ncbi:TasA family protein [Blastococcus sp. SYSU D00868]